MCVTAYEEMWQLPAEIYVDKESKGFTRRSRGFLKIHAQEMDSGLDLEHTYQH